MLGRPTICTTRINLNSTAHHSTLTFPEHGILLLAIRESKLQLLITAWITIIPILATAVVLGIA
jgi:hypothetical protein